MVFDRFLFLIGNADGFGLLELAGSLTSSKPFTNFLKVAPWLR